MVLDEPTKEDLQIQFESLLFLFDPFTVKTFEEPITLSYSDIQGFKLSTPSEIIAYGIHLHQIS